MMCLFIVLLGQQLYVLEGFLARLHLSELLIRLWCSERANVIDHFQAGWMVAAFCVEFFLLFATVEDCLVASGAFGNRVERIHKQTSKTLALVLFGDANLLDMANDAPIMNTSARRC